ncbi:hypothetical protein EGW08_014122, partial [Elysia chlorotica]
MAALGTGPGSPLLPLASSKICWDWTCDRSSQQDTDNLEWVSISSGPRDQQGTGGSSQYTYTSTYTYGSSTTKSENVTRKKQARLNSTVSKGKRNVQETEFPDFLSPISQNTTWHRDQQGTGGSSQYTYSSTYSYGSSTAKSGNVTHKKQAKLNSTVCKGMRNVQEMEFPDFLSPIGQNTG